MADEKIDFDVKVMSDSWRKAIEISKALSSKYSDLSYLYLILFFPVLPFSIKESKIKKLLVCKKIIYKP